MNLRQRLNQIAKDSVAADEEYVDYIHTCIVQCLESAAKQGLLSDNLDVDALRRRCVHHTEYGELEVPRAVAWDDGLAKALCRISDEGVLVDLCDESIEDMTPASIYLSWGD